MNRKGIFDTMKDKNQHGMASASLKFKLQDSLRRKMLTGKYEANISQQMHKDSIIPKGSYYYYHISNERLNSLFLI